MAMSILKAVLIIGSVKVFWGTDHKVGTTMLAQSFAELISKGNDSVLLLTLSTNLGDDFYTDQTNNMEDLRKKLSCGLITKENIRQYAVKGNKYHKLNGLSNEKAAYEFTKDMIDELINTAESAFDNVIIDSGTGLSNPLPISALTYGRDNITIFSQQESSIRRYEYIAEQMSRIGSIIKTAVINRFIKGDKLSIGYFAQRTNLPQNIFKTVTESEFGIQAEADRQTLLYYGDSKFEKEIIALN